MGILRIVHGDLIGLDHVEEARLVEEAVGWPMDMTILIDPEISMTQLQTDAHNAVDRPGIVVVALDPANHHIATRFGTATVKAADFDTVGKAGNVFFHNKQYVEGFEAIGNATAATMRGYASTQVPVVPPMMPVPAQMQNMQNSPVAGITTLLFMLVGFSTVLYLMWRGRKNQARFEKVLTDTQLEAAELRSRNVEIMTLPEDSYTTAASAPTPAPSYLKSAPSPSRRRSVQSAQPHHNRRAVTQPSTTVIVDPVVVPAPLIIERDTSSYTSDYEKSSGYDVGGSAVSYDSPSYDSGGSSSDYDSGSSGSSGGSDGGSDGGGSSGDF